MSIKAKLLLSALSEILLIVIFSTFLVVSSRQISHITSNETKASTIVASITQIRFVTFENLLHHDKRSFDQWQSKHQELATLLFSYPVSNAEEKVYIDRISEQQKAIGPIFNKLHASYISSSAGQNGLVQNQYQERLASQLISKQQIEISEALKLTSLKSHEALVLRQQTSSLAVMIIVLMFLITVINFIFVFSAISRALLILQKGARAIVQGKLDYRIKYKRAHDEFGVLASTFNHMAASVEQVDNIKSEFVLLVSHQLRTPATAVKGFISLFQDHYADNLTPKQHDLLAQAYEENERQIQIINEILVVAQFDTGEMKLNKQPSDVLRIARSVVAEQKLTLEARSQQANIVQSSVLPEINIDPEKIRIVIENLVHNASKFSPQGSQITVKLQATKTLVQIQVTDEGQGLGHDELQRLFKRFSHSSNPGTLRAEGAGLGLYLAKQIVDLHHGKISVASVIGEGTTFTVQLPRDGHKIT
jgi:signal transduction histidine kinase